jgi:hypothetical protein
VCAYAAGQPIYLNRSNHSVVYGVKALENKKSFTITPRLNGYEQEA